MRHIFQNTAHGSPTLIADQVQQRFLGIVPAGPGVAQQFCALLCEGNDPRSLVATGTAFRTHLTVSSHRTGGQTMNIVVIGGTGLIGPKTVAILMQVRKAREWLKSLYGR